MVLFGLVLWYINHCRLFNTNSPLYIYIKYIWFGLVGFYVVSTIGGYLIPNPFIHIYQIYMVWFGWVGFYGISTIGGYLIPNPLYTYISNIYMVWFGWVLWHINHCRLFIANSSLYMHIRYIQGQATWSDTPYLNPLNFFLRGYLKSKVYSNHPQSTEQLKDAIRQEITAIPREMTRRVIDNFHECLKQCVDNNRSHLTDLIFKTEWNRMALYVLFENKKHFFVSLLYLSFIKPTNVSDHFDWPCIIWFGFMAHQPS